MIAVSNMDGFAHSLIELFSRDELLDEGAEGIVYKKHFEAWV